MTRATYCRDQARFCRELEAQLSVTQERVTLRQMADRYDAEADDLETQAQTEQQQRPRGPNQ